MTLGSTQPLTEMSTRNISWWGKGGLYVVLTEIFIDIILPAALCHWDRLSLLTEMSTRNISWSGKDDRCVVLTTLPPSCAVASTLQGMSRPVMGLRYFNLS